MPAPGAGHAPAFGVLCGLLPAGLACRGRSGAPEPLARRAIPTPAPQFVQ